MKILHKYVLKEHLGPLLFALTALTSLMLLQYIAKRFGELVGKGLPWQAIVEFLALSIPLTIALTMPMAVLVATLYAFSRLASENEFTALKANGVGPWSIMKPVVLGGLGVTVAMIIFNDQVLSAANHRLRVLQTDIAQKKPTFGLREQVINEVSPGKLYLRAGHLDRQRSNKMRDVVIYDMSDPTRRRTIYADSGDMAMTNNQRDLNLTLYDGSMQDVPVATPSQLQRLYFDVDRVRIAGVGNEFRKSENDQYKSDREMTVCEMRAAATKARKNYDVARAQYQLALKAARDKKQTLSKDAFDEGQSAPGDAAFVRAYCGLVTSILPKPLGAQQAPSGGSPAVNASESAAIARARLSRIGSTNEIDVTSIQPLVDAARARMVETSTLVNSYYVEIHKKFALAVACLIFVILGAPVALRFPRGGVGLTIGVSLLVFALYYICLIGGEALAKRGMMPAFVSMWLANIIFGTAGVYLLSKMGTESATSRGGELAETFANMRQGIRRRQRRKPNVAA